MKENKFMTWVKNHKKELIVTGVVIIGGVLVAKNWDTIKSLFAKDCKVTSEIINMPNDGDIKGTLNNTIIANDKVIDVREHLRDLPKGQHHSVSKTLEAESRGIVLPDEMTLVRAHTRCYVA